MEILPAKDVIVLKKPEQKKENVSAGGIVLPANVREPNSDKVGEVVVVGSSIEGLQPGDLVVFSTAYANTANIEGKMFLFCKEENILAKLS